jgi:SSS family solute:Na+ symporter
VNTVVPLLFDAVLPRWFAGAAIALSALVPAAIMAIAAANLFTRNVYKEYLRPDASPAEEARSSKVVSVVVKAGAVAVILFLKPEFSIDLQLIGGVIVLQTLPALLFGLSRCGRIGGRSWPAGRPAPSWVCGWSTSPPPWTPVPGERSTKHRGGAQFALSHLGPHTKLTVYAGLLAVLLNLVVTGALTLASRGPGLRLRRVRSSPPSDAEHRARVTPRTAGGTRG